MLLDIEPLCDDGIQSCISFNVEAVMKWCQLNFELMYMDNWNFVFYESNEHCTGIWTRGELAGRLNYEHLLQPQTLLAKFHGMELKAFKGNGDEVIEEQLSAGRPVVIFYDTYYLPWLEEFYQQVHSTHAILLVGKDEENNYYCNDTRPFFKEPIKAGKLDCEIFQKGFLNEGIIFEANEFFGQKLSYDELQKGMRAVLHDNSGMIENFTEFINYMGCHSIKDEELQSFDGGHGILIRAIRNIIRGRINFCKALTYINENYEEIQLTSVIQLFEDTISEWDRFKLLLYKCGVKGDINKYKSQTSEMLNKILKIEILAYQQLNELFSD